MASIFSESIRPMSENYEKLSQEEDNIQESEQPACIF